VLDGEGVICGPDGRSEFDYDWHYRKRHRRAQVVEVDPRLGEASVKPKYHTGRRHAGRDIKMEAIRTFQGAECIYDLAPGADGRWYLIYEMIDPPTWAMSWPSLEAARRFLDPMSVEEAEQIEHVILLVVEKTGQVIVSDLGEANSVQGFLQDLDKVAAEAIARGRLH
jgi:hypothetical protein